MEMRTMIDFAPLSRYSVGFDRLFDLLDQTTQPDATDTYPPYNIERTGENEYRITLAVAGFAPEELSIVSQPNRLVVSGRKAEGPGGEYLYQGLAGRSFERQFSLADHVKVTTASLKNGMLVIGLVRELPEAMKPRRIEITDQNQPKAIEGQPAA
jgi:molecular chaperone IbpA